MNQLSRRLIVLATVMYSEALRQFRIGYGTAMSVILFAIILAVTPSTY